MGKSTINGQKQRPAMTAWLPGPTSLDADAAGAAGAAPSASGTDCGDDSGTDSAGAAAAAASGASRMPWIWINNNILLEFMSISYSILLYPNPWLFHGYMLLYTMIMILLEFIYNLYTIGYDITIYGYEYTTIYLYTNSISLDMMI